MSTRSPRAATQRLRRHPWAALAVAAALTTAAAAPAVAAGPGASPDGAPAGRTDVAGSKPSYAVPAAKAGATPSTASVTARVYLRMRDQAGAEAAIAAISTPGSPTYHHYLSTTQVQSAFAPAASSVAAVEAWAQANHLEIGSVPANRAYVPVTGTAAQVQSAFAVQLAQYRVSGQLYRAADRLLSLPASVASLVTSVVGVSQAAHHPTPSVAAAPAASASVAPPPAGFRNAPPCSAYFGQKTATVPKFDGLPTTLPVKTCGYVPSQIRSAYGLSTSTAAGIDGRGTTVAIVDAFASPTLLSDAQTYAKRNDPTHPLASTQFSKIVFPATTSLEPADECDASGWYGEQTLDVEAVHATAPGAHILYVGASDCLDSSLDVAVNEIVANHLADVVTNSYGEPELEEDDQDAAALHSITIEAALEGITLTFSSGDSGDESGNLGGIVSADYPAVEPYVTAVGGTSLAIGKNGQKDFETGWETITSTLDPKTRTWTPPAPGLFQAGSGGGTSRLYSEPLYQYGVVPAALAETHHTGLSRGRVVPDVSMDADPNTGFLVGETQTFPDGTYYDQYTLGGTSLASPLFAGVVALSDQVHGASQGLINPTVYQVLSRTGAINDVTHHDGAVIRYNYANSVDASAGIVTVLRRFDDQTDLTIRTTPGYDDTTGLGSPNGRAFLAGL